MTDWLTTTEAAALLNVDQSRIRQMAIAGQIEARKWGRDWQVSRQSIEAWRKSHEGQEKRGRKPMERIVDGRYYTMQHSRLVELSEATGIAGETIASIALDQDWPEGAEHQTWLNEAPIAEIASWVKEIADEQGA